MPIINRKRGEENACQHTCVLGGSTGLRGHLAIDYRLSSNVILFRGASSGPRVKETKRNEKKTAGYPRERFLEGASGGKSTV